LAERVDFSRNAPVYDRRHGAFLADEAVDRLLMAAGDQPGAVVLDIGAGTGRVAIPFAANGCSVVALEPARGMIEQLQAKGNEVTLSPVIGEGSRLPFAARTFDCCVIARLLYLAEDWREIIREAHRVLAINGSLLPEWGNGQADEEWVKIREEARRLFEQAGVRKPFHPGVRTEAEVEADLASVGLVRVAEVPISPGPSVLLGEFLRRVVDGEVSYIWNVPQDVQAKCIPQLRAWVEETFDLDRRIEIPREIRWTVYRKQRA
jgi:SAM-dependent methyltransferase